ncbi:acyl-coenzyme A synthetase ACSM3, mitochondrial [Ixodes scapularis]
MRSYPSIHHALEKFYCNDGPELMASGRETLRVRYRIGPFEVESVLAKHPAVAECAVVGSPDPNRGEVVKAFVVLQASHRNIEDLDGLAVELQEFVKKNTAPYKYPRKVEFVGELPKTISGKVLRTSLRERENPNKVLLPQFSANARRTPSRHRGVPPPTPTIISAVSPLGLPLTIATTFSVSRVSLAPALDPVVTPPSTLSVSSATTPPREHVFLKSPEKLSAATPGGGVAEDDRSKEPPRTPERSDSTDVTHRNDAPATVANNLNVVIDGHDASALEDTGADYSALSGRLALSPPSESDATMGWPENTNRRSVPGDADRKVHSLPQKDSAIVETSTDVRPLPYF